MSLIDLILLSLATYRATRLLTRDEILGGVRNKVFDRFPPNTSKLGYVFTCEWCMSIWVGSGFVLWSIISSTVFSTVALILSVSAVTGLLTAYEDR